MGMARNENGFRWNEMGNIMQFQNSVAEMKMGAPPETAPEWPVGPGKRQNVRCCSSKSEMQVVAE